MEKRKTMEEIAKAEFGSWENNRNDHPLDRLAKRKRENIKIAKISNEKGVCRLSLQKLKRLYMNNEISYMQIR